MTKGIKKAARTFALLVVLCATGQAWAATALQPTVLDGSVTIGVASSLNFDNASFSTSSPKLTIPGSESLPNGTKVAISTIALGKRTNDKNPENTDAPDKIKISVGTTDFTSASKTESGTFTSSGNSRTSVKMVYSFAGTGCILEVGTTYDITLLDSSGSTKTSVNLGLINNSESMFGNTLQYSDAYRPLQELTGEIIYTCTVASDGTTTWDIEPPASGANCWYEVADSATFDIGTLSCKSAYFNVGDGQTLTLSGSVNASSGIYVLGGTVAAPLAGLSGTLKGDGTLCYDMNNGTTKPSGLTCTDSSWTGTLWLKNGAYTGWNFNGYGSTASTVKISNITCYLNDTETLNPVLELEGEGLKITNGNGYKIETVKKLKGSGALSISGGSSNGNGFVIQDASEFAGSITTPNNRYLVTIGASGSSGTSGKIVINNGYSATVASGKTWTAGGGFQVNGTLTLEDSTSGLSGTVTGSGTIACDGFLPAVTGLTASGWTGTVQVAADAESGTEWTNQAIMNSGSAIEITAGMLKVADVSNLTGSFSLATGTYLWLTDSTSESASIKVSDFSGNLYVQRPNEFTSMQFDLGTIRSIGGSVTLSSQTLPVELTLTEVKGEGGAIDASGLTAFTGRTLASTTYKVRRLDGVTVDATLENGTLTYTPSISGAATDIDWDFTDGTDDALEQAPSGVTRNYDSTLTFYTDAEDSTYTGVYLKHHPYVEGAGDFIHNNSSAITVAAVGTMPSGDKSIFMNFGSAYANKYGLLLANTETANEVLVAYNYGATVTPITTMTVPNAATARHSYIITKEDGESSTTFTVYLDGIKWKTVTTAFKIEFSSANTGIQFGSDFGGNIRNAGYNAVSGDTGILNVLRVYGRVIKPAEIAQYASIYPYVSPNGSSTRMFTTAAESWIDTTEDSEVWMNSDEDNSGAPTEGASLTVVANADTIITVNLEEETEYEALTINENSVKFVPSSGLVKITGMTVIGTVVTNVYGAVDMAGGPMTIAADGDITFDYSAYDISAIYKTTDIPLTSDVDEDSTKVHLIAPSAAYRTVSLVYTSGHYAMRVTPDHEAGSDVYYTGGYWGTTEDTFAVTNASGEATIVFPGDTVVIPAYYSGSSAYFGAALPVNVSAIRVEKDFTFESGIDDTAILGGAAVTIADGCTLSFATSWHNLTLGAVAFNGPGGVSIPSLSRTVSVAGAVSGTAPLTVIGAVSVAADGSIANTVSGSGTLTFALLPSSALSFGTWTGTVVIPAVTSGASGLNLNNYGVVGSTVRTAGTSSGAWLANAAVVPTVDLAGDMTLTAFSSNFANTFNKMTGSGAFSLTADGTGEGYADGYFLVEDVSDFTGSITVVAPGLALGGSSKPTSTEWYGMIVIQDSVVVGSGATWTATNVVLADPAATLTVPAGASVPTVVRGIAGYGVSETTVDGNTVYSLVKRGTIFSVY